MWKGWVISSPHLCGLSSPLFCIHSVCWYLGKGGEGGCVQDVATLWAASTTRVKQWELLAVLLLCGDSELSVPWALLVLLH